MSVTITGAGLSNGTVNTSSGDITVNVTQTSNTQIQATFTVSATARGGNVGITVTNNGQTSNSINFYVQLPTSLVFYNTSITPNNGHSTPVTGTNINIINVGGNVIASNACGGYEWTTYVLNDQQGNQIKNGTVTFTESFSNISSGDFTDPVGGSVSENLSFYALGDTHALWATAPTCPPANGTQSFDQTWLAAIAGRTLNLTTVIYITRTTNSSGLPTFTITITTP